MQSRFGDYQLDTSTRTLSFRGKPVEVQPRVFDLLAYLVRNAGRVVPKDELLDTLWPGIHVGEASLQRAVSLARAALRPGGMDTAIKNYVRFGYRFGVDESGLGAIAPDQPARTPDMNAARAAAQVRDWTEVARLFAEHADADQIGAKDLDLWALALECLARPSEAIAPLGRAVEAHLADKNPASAARSAVTLAKIYLERGEMALSRGWLARAEALFAEETETEAYGFFLWMKSRFAAFEGEPEKALELTRRAVGIAELTGAMGLQALALTYTGFYNLSLGKTTEGLAQQDHAAAIALSGQVDPITGSLVYCNILWSCRSFADWTRATQWSAGFESWCKSCYAETSGSCDLHRAEILGHQGTLKDALAKINHAIGKLPNQEPWSLGDAYRVRGDIQAMLGNDAAARADYTLAYSTGWDAEPGNARMLFTSGDSEGALAALDRALSGTSWTHLQRQGLLLANKAYILAAMGRAEQANSLIDILEKEGDRWPMPAIRATIAEARSQLAFGAGEDRIGLRLLHLARQLWTSIGDDFNDARVRLHLAEHMLAVGDRSGASSELSAGWKSAEKIGAKKLLDRLKELSRQLAGDADASA